MRILALFDDGNGSVKKALPEHDVVSVGIENADVVMDLSDLSNIKKLVDMHKKEPFDLLMASPPHVNLGASQRPETMGTHTGIKTAWHCELFKTGKSTRMYQSVNWLSATPLKFLPSIPDICEKA